MNHATKPSALEVIDRTRPLNNAQRKALSDSVEKRLNSKADAARQKEQQLEREIVGKLAARFKVDAANARIKVLEAEIKSLKDAREQLGFQQGYDNEIRIIGGDAKKLLEAEVREHSFSLRTIEDRREAIKQAIWLAETADEARTLITEIDEL